MASICRLNFILLFWVFLITFNCTKNSTAPQPERPDRPKFVAKSLDNAVYESGIDAVPEGNGIFIHWYLPQANRIQWIKIYRKTEYEEEYQFLASVDYSDTLYVDYDVELDLRYFYFLKAVDFKKIESLASDTVNYRLYPKANGLHATAQPRPVFAWQYQSLPPIGYLLRLEEEASANVVWLSFVESYDLLNQVEFNWDGKARLDSLQLGNRYRWRIDVLGADLFSGSESNWKLLLLVRE